MKKFFKRARNVALKLSKGTDVLSVPLPQEKWDHQFQKGYWNFLLEHPYNIAVTTMMIAKRTAEMERPLRILDVGCGNGALARSLHGVSIEYWGTDISQVALDQAKELYPDGKYVCVSMDEDPKLDVQFDMIVFSEVLLYGKYRDILPLHRPYLAKDGVLIVSLYATWRTRLIWWFVDKQLQILEDVYVTNNKSKTGWRIKMGTLT